MRHLTERDRLDRFMVALGHAGRQPARVYFTGGASAVLLGWRTTTIDIDLALVPDSDELLRAIADLKERLEVNIELASPAHFIPELPGWDTRSLYIRREGPIAFYHYDFYAQALAKIERGHTQDHADVRSMLAAHLVEPARLRELFDAIRPALFRYPALDEASFQAAVERALVNEGGEGTP
ncbi:MAG: hypothetical protein Q8L86_19410 [Vicinamibacterales bacterium]|nr:hypothetical protein [Vicinamibacterales bacterium]